MSTDTTNGMELCEILWNEYEPSIRRLCNYKLSANKCEVDDVVADVYLSLCNAVKSGHIINNPKAWLFGTANNYIKLKYAELNLKKKKFIHINDFDSRLFYDIDFENNLISDYKLEVIKDSIYDELLTSEKTLLVLKYTKKLKYKEIAQILNTTEDAVKQRHYRLKRKVKLLIKEKLNEL